MATKIENQKMIQKYHYDIVDDDVQPQLSIKNPSSPSSLSLSTSPSHEFSFAISLETTTKIIDSDHKLNTTIHDLTPADEIFFHGHLLPLQLLSRHHHHHHHHHLPTAPVSPRSSTNSMDSFTLPITELLPNNNTSSSKRFHDYYLDYDNDNNNNHLQENRGGKSSKSNFSLLFGISNWRKGSCDQKREIKDDQRSKLKFEVTRVVKRYMKLVKPLLSFKTAAGRRDHQVLGKPYSLSGNLLVKNKKSAGGRREGAYSSAPVTMRNNSPTNSGHLIPTGTLSPTTTTSTSDSTMEELQAAIQAAIAHCKKSQLNR